MLYSHMQIHIYIYTEHHNDTINKETSEDFFINTCTSHFIVRVRKGCVGFYCERELETEQNWNILTPTFMAVNVVSFLFSGCSTGGPEAHSTGWWISLLHLISIFSGPQLLRAPRPFGLVWLSLRHLVYNSVRSLTATHLTSVLTELYNSSTPTQSPTRSLKSHVWSSSSGNNCHAVDRSLSSGASVYEYTMGIFFTSSHFVSQFPPTRFPLITAFRMCHLLPVHHFGMAFLAGSKVKIPQLLHINTWNHLTVCKQIINSKYHYSYYIAILETI